MIYSIIKDKILQRAETLGVDKISIDEVLDILQLELNGCVIDTEKVNSSHIGVGTKLYGFCEGYFQDDDSNETKTIEAIGPDWVVVRQIVVANGGRDIYEAPYIAHFKGFTFENMLNKLKEWSKEPDDF